MILCICLYLIYHYCTIEGVFNSYEFSVEAFARAFINDKQIVHEYGISGLYNFPKLASNLVCL